jgi:N-methylhydantoinase A
MKAPRYRAGIDVGGTFTDLVLLDLVDGTVRTEKALTTPADPWEGIWLVLQQSGVPIEDVEIAHGTTIGLNALLERRGTPTGLITTRGFRDIYEIGTGARTEMYNLFFRKPVPLVPREHRLEVSERLDPQGEVVVPLNDDDVLAAAHHFREFGIADIAVCFLHSYRNPVHERRAASILRDVYPDALVSCSHELVRQWKEYERTSTTAVNAYIRRNTASYLEQAARALDASGYTRDFFVNQSSGGIVSARTSAERPVSTLMSGPAGGVAAGAKVGGAAELADVITFDMGGTSTDVAVITSGRPHLTADTRIDEHPIALPSIAIRSIGAGGGSIAWIDEVGALNVGPRSAGPDPGPVCYTRGGTEPTVTDANLVLGRLAPSEFVPGGLKLDAERAAAAIEDKVARPLGLDLEAAAAGILEIVNLKMAMAVRAVTIERGLDPKDFVLFAFGGAGAAHAAWIARELEIPRVVVPTAPGQFSALGIAVSDVRHDFVRTALSPLEALRSSTLTKLFESIETDARAALADEHVPTERIVLIRTADVRYQGQEYTISVPVPEGALDKEDLRMLRADFDRLHEQIYSYSAESVPAELVNARVEATGCLGDVNLPAMPSGGTEPAPAAAAGTVEMTIDPTSGTLRAAVWRRSALVGGNRLLGPAIVADVGATTIVPPGSACRVDPNGNLLIEAAA